MNKIVFAFGFLALFCVNVLGQGNLHLDLVTIQGNYLYSSWSHLPNYAGTEIAVYDISDPLNPLRTGAIVDSVHASKLICRGDRVYAPGLPADLFIIDVSNPAQPHIIGQYDGEWYRGRDIILMDTLAILLWSTCDYETALGGIDILNIANESAPTRLLRFNLPTQNCGLAMAKFGNYLYIVGGDAFTFTNGHLTVVDITNLLAPVILTTIDLSNQTVGIAISGHYAYIIDNVYGNLNNGMRVYDLTDPANPSFTAIVGMPGPKNILIDGNYAFVAADTSGIWLIDISDPTSPTVLQTIDTPGKAEGIAARTHYLYVADYDSLRIIESDLLSIDDKPIIPDQPTMLRGYPNPFNSSIIFSVKTQTSGKLSVYDLAGQEVWRCDLEGGSQRVRWDAKDLAGRSLASGIYLAKLYGNGQEAQMKLVYLK